MVYNRIHSTSFLEKQLYPSGNKPYIQISEITTNKKVLMERLTTLVTYLQYLIFPFCFFVVIYVIYSFYKIIIKRHYVNRTLLIKKMSKGDINSANITIDAGKMADGYSSFISLPQNVCEIGKIFGEEKAI